MKWSLFDKKNHELLLAIKEKYQLTDDYIAQAKECADIASSISRQAIEHRQYIHPTRARERHKNIIMDYVKEQLKTAMGTQKSSVHEHILGVARTNPSKNNTLYVYCLKMDAKHGKEKLISAELSNPNELKSGDVVIIRKTNKITTYREAPTARGHKVARKKVVTIRRKTSIQLAHVEKYKT